MATAAVPQAIEEDAPVIVQNAKKGARVKGTWTMYFGAERFDFIDGQRYELSPDLYEYLRRSGNIYDTLA